MKKSWYEKIVTHVKKLLLLLHIAVAAIILCFYLRFLKIPRLLSYWGKTKRVEIDHEKVENIINIILTLSKIRFFVIKNICLRKTILLFHFLRGAGLTGLELVIGVKKSGDKLAGHSWLVLDNKPFLDDLEFVENYEVIYSTVATYEK